MGFMMTAALIVFMGWIFVRSMNREKAGLDRSKAIKARLSAAHGLEDVFVFPGDGGFLGLSAAGDRILIGKDEAEQALAVADLLAIEGLRDETVLVRAARSGGDLTPAPSSRNPADLPERIRSLSLRLTTADGVHTVLFFDGGKHGVAPSNEAFRQQAGQTEAWFRKLSNVMRLEQA